MILIGGPDDERFQATRRRLLAGAGGLASAGLAGCLGDDGSDDGGDELTTVRILNAEAALYTPVYMYGMENDIWRDRGINLSMQVTGFGQFVRAFSAEQAEHFSPNPALTLAENIAEGEPVRIFGSHMNEINGVYVRQDSDIESPPDLEGRILGVDGLGATTTRTFRGIWQELYDFDLADDPAEVVDSASASLYDLLAEDEDIDAAIMFTGFSVAAEADDRLRSIFDPVEEWTGRTGRPAPVTLYGAYEETIENEPELVQEYWNAWVDAVELFREDFNEAVTQYGAVGGMDLAEEAEIAVIESFVEDEALFPAAWDEDWIDSVSQLFDLVNDTGGITGVPGDDGFVTHDEL